MKYVFRPSIGAKSHGDIRYFGLTWSTVGADTENDMFQHIDERDLAAQGGPAVPDETPAPEPDPDAGTTPTPTPAETAQSAGRTVHRGPNTLCVWQSERSPVSFYYCC